jgi:hypothetical protein
VIFVVLEKVVFEDNGDVDVPGAGDELKLELFCIRNQVKEFNTFEVFGAEIFEDLFDYLGF